MEKNVLACVIWNDAHGSDGTLAEHEIEHKPYRFTAVGFLVKSDSEGVSLAFERGEDGRWRDVSFIPRLMVIEEWIIGPLRKPRKRVIHKPEAAPLVPLD